MSDGLDPRWPLIVALALFLSPRAAATPFDYRPYRLFELATQAELVVAGRITEVREADVTIEVERWIAGEAHPAPLLVDRFEDWTCAGRGRSYGVGDELLLFLETSYRDEARWVAMGGGNSGDMPRREGEVLLQGFRVHGRETTRWSFGDAPVLGTQVSLDELVSAVRGLREHVRWSPWDHTARPPRRTLASVDEEGLVGLASSSTLARHLAEQVASSPDCELPLERKRELMRRIDPGPERDARLLDTVRECAQRVRVPEAE